DSCVWFGIGSIRSDKQSGRGTAADVVAIPGLWLEADYGKAGGPETMDAARDLLAAMPLPPTMIVHTGHGLHGYWCFREAFVFSNDDDRSRAQRLLLSWREQLLRLYQASGYGAKPDSVSDLARVFRPAGTENCKDPASRLPVAVIHCDEGTRYAVDDFA